MPTYESLRQQFKPTVISVLFIAESPPPAATVESSRHFYRAEKLRDADRLFVNTIKALYPAAAGQSEAEIETKKYQWLKQFQADGYYMIEALETSQTHAVTKAQRQARIQAAIPTLVKKVQTLASKNTKIILIKSNVFVVAAAPLRAAGYTVLNRELLDYPGQFAQKTYREKLKKLLDIGHE